MDNEGDGLDVLAWALAASPLILLALFVSLGAHIRLGLGHWPEPMTDNYDTLWFDLHELLFTGCLLFVWFLAGPLWLGCLVLDRDRPYVRRVFGRQALMIAVGCILGIALVAADPYCFLEWFLD